MVMLPKDRVVRNIIDIFDYLKKQKITSITLDSDEKTKTDTLKITYKNGDTWILVGDEFDVVRKEHPEQFDEDFLCFQLLVEKYFKEASQEFIDVFAKLLISDLDWNLHDELDRMKEAGYKRVKYGWRPDSRIRKLSSEIKKENKLLRDGSDEEGCFDTWGGLMPEGD